MPFVRHPGRQTLPTAVERVIVAAVNRHSGPLEDNLFGVRLLQCKN